MLSISFPVHRMRKQIEDRKTNSYWFCLFDFLIFCADWSKRGATKIQNAKK